MLWSIELQSLNTFSLPNANPGWLSSISHCNSFATSFDLASIVIFAMRKQKSIPIPILLHFCLLREQKRPSMGIEFQARFLPYFQALKINTHTQPFLEVWVLIFRLGFYDPKFNTHTSCFYVESSKGDSKFGGLLWVWVL